jgi:thioredoxin-related protein
VKRIALLAAVALLFVQQASASPWLKDIASAQKIAKEKNQLIFVDLFADWCGWCHRFEQEVIPSQSFQNATDKMVLLRLNTEDGKDGSKFARDFSVNSLPTFLVLNKDLMIAGIIKGYAPAKEFAASLGDAEVKYNDFMKRAADEASISKDYAKRLALAKEFESRAAYAQSEARLKKLVAEPGIPPTRRSSAMRKRPSRNSRRCRTRATRSSARASSSATSTCRRGTFRARSRSTKPSGRSIRTPRTPATST